jgi:hypothetical protein
VCPYLALHASHTLAFAVARQGMMYRINSRLETPDRPPPLDWCSRFFFSSSFFGFRVSVSSSMAYSTKDITGDLCHCSSGKAKVAHFVTENGKLRFFWGCDKSTAMAQCKGPDAWYRIQVPEEQRIAYAKAKGIEYVPKAADGGKKKHRVKVVGTRHPLATCVDAHLSERGFKRLFLFVSFFFSHHRFGL